MFGRMAIRPARRLMMLLAILCLLTVIWAFTHTPRAAKELIDAARAGDVKRVQELLDAHPRLVNFRSNDKHVRNGTPLCAAIDGRRRRVVELLLARGADPDRGAYSRVLPLRHAAFDAQWDIVELLLQNGADARGADDILYRAAADGRKHVVELLLVGGADVNANFGGPGMVKGEWRHIGGSTALHAAAGNGHEEIVRLLLAVGAGVHARDAYGASPLHEAAQWGHKDVAEQLLANGADIDARNEDGQTPLGLALEDGHKELAQFLKHHGAKE